jgi:ketosteroid isomerase-like protein
MTTWAALAPAGYHQGTLPPVTSASRQPRRFLLRLAGALTQVGCAGCLLLGTIAFVLVQQNASGGAELAILWAVLAMAGLVFGGLMARGGLFSLLASALLDAGFGIALLVLDGDTLASLLHILADEDVAMIGDALVGMGVGMVAVAALCLAAITQALRYGRWLHAAASLDYIPAAATNREFPPPPVPALPGSVWRMPAAPPAETRSRRRMYFALAGFAIGFGAGIGVLVSSTAQPARTSSAAGTGTTDPPAATGSAAGDVTDASRRDGGVAATPPPPITTLLDTQRAALASGDLAALAATLAPDAVGFGTAASAYAVGPEALAARLREDLGALPAGGVTVDVQFGQIGQERDHAWIAQELAITVRGRGKRVFAVTQLAAAIGGSWQVVAWHWAVPVPDRDAERIALLGRKPAPAPIGNKLDGPRELEAAVRAAFASREAFVDARSEREDAFNFGSGPKERIIGGRSIRRIFAGLRDQITLHDGIHAVAGSAWDERQRDAPWIGIALVNADFKTRTRAATDLTYTFRVLAVVLREGDAWKLVQTQWSHGGPMR